ncbi:MAG: phage tail tape measure protein [Bacteroidaceae bacterium]|nr:phage tail tape measure protein [Bacteroidaceae bacterium]
MAGIKFDITGDNRNVLDSFNGVQQGVRRMQSAVEKSGNSIESMFQRVTSSALGGIKQLAAGVAGLNALMESGSFIKTLYGDMGKFVVAMKEVSTLSEEVTNNLEEYKQKVVELCTQIAIAPEEAAKALYQIESAGHHGADGLRVLEESAKGAIGGVTETEVAADAITTILNSYKMSAEEAAHVNDLLFTTVRLGKTTYGELGRVIAQVTPVAAAYGVAIEDVLAAVASLTKSGTKTSIAVRQVRDAITATTASLGDGTFKTRTFLEAMDEVAEKTKGSESALKSDLSKLSAMNAVLALTGENAASAKQDFIDMQNSTGAATEAYEKMATTAGNATTRLRNNIFAYFMPIGDEIRTMGKNIAESLNEAFDTGSMQTALGTLEAFVASYAVYRTMLAASSAKTSLVNASEIAATNAMYEAEIAQLQAIIPLKEAEAKSDIEIAVAEGRLTPEKAALITALREEAAAHLEKLQAEAAAAKVAFEESTTIAAQTAIRLEEAEAAVAAAEMKYEAAVRSGNATAIESAELELNTAASNRNAVAKELQTAREVASAAASKASTTAKLAESAATVIDSTATKADTAATGVLAGVKLTLKKAIDAVNASFLASPLFWMGAVIVGVTYGIYKLVTAESEAEKATRKANEAMEEQNKINDERRDKVMGLLRTIQDKNQTELAQMAAYNKLKTLVPDITDKYSLQALATMEAAESQKELNHQLEEQEYEEAKKKAEEYRKQVEALKKEIGDNSQTRAKNQLPGVEANLKLWEDKVRKYEELQAKIREENTPIEIRIQEAQENYNTKKEILDFYTQAKDLADHWQEANEAINYVTGETRLDSFIAKAEEEISDLHRQAENSPIKEKLELEAQEKQKILDALKDMKKQAQESGSDQLDFWVNVQFNMNYTQLQMQVQAYLNKLNGLTQNTVAGGAVSLAVELDAAKTRFEAAQKALKNITDNASQHTKEELISAQSELKTAKENYEALGGDPEGKEAKKKQQAAKQAANERAQKIKAEQKYQELLRKQRVERERAARDLELSTSQATIDAMEEGSQKTLAQITLDFEKQREEIKRGYEDLRQKKIDEARRLWEANPANKGKAFDESSVNTEYTEEETKNYEQLNRANRQNFVRQIASMELPDLPQSYIKDRIAQIKEAYQREIDAIAEEERKLKEQQGGTITQAQKAVFYKRTEDANTQMQEGVKALEDAEVERAKQKYKALLEEYKSYDQKRRDLDKKYNEDMDLYRAKRKEITDAGGDTTDIDASMGERTKQYKQDIQDLQDDILESSDFYTKLFGDISSKGYKVLKEFYAQAQETMDNARTLADGVEIDVTVKDADGKFVKKAVKVTVEEFQKMKDKVKEIRDELDKENPFAAFKTAWSDLKKAMKNDGDVQGNLKKLNEKGKELTSTIQGWGDSLGAVFGDSFAQSIQEMMTMVDSVMDMGTGIAQIYSGDIVGGITNTLSGLSSIVSLFTSWKEKMEEMQREWYIAEIETARSLREQAEEYAGMRSTISDIIKRTEELNWLIEHGMAKVSTVSLWTAQNEQLAEYKKSITDAQHQTDELWNKVRGERGEYSWGNSLNGGSESWSLANATEEQLELWYNQNKLSDAAKQYYEAWKESGESVEKLRDQIAELYANMREEVMGVNFDSWLSNVNSTLKSAKGDVKDFADFTEDTIVDALMNAFMYQHLASMMEPLYNSLSDALVNGEADKDFLDNWEAEFQRKMAEANAQLDSIAEMTGRDPRTADPYEQSGTSGGWQSMGQETADELNGRFTALQMSGEIISEGVTAMMATLAALSALADGRNITLVEIRNLMITNNAYLEDILNANKEYYKKFDSKLDKIVTQTK